jgi:hypothetical protein
MIKNLRGFVILSCSFLSAAPEVVATEKQSPIATALTSSINAAREIMSEKVAQKTDKIKDSFTSENALHLLKNGADYIDQKLSELPAKKAILYGLGIAIYVKSPVVRTLIGAPITSLIKATYPSPSRVFARAIENAKIRVGLTAQKPSLLQMTGNSLINTKNFLLGKAPVKTVPLPLRLSDGSIEYVLPELPAMQNKLSFFGLGRK